MANSDNPRGLIFLRTRDASPTNEPAQPYFLPSTDAVDMFIGDPVVKTGTSNTTAVGSSTQGQFQPGTLPVIVKATAGTGNAITGVIVGFQPEQDLDNQIFRDASTNRVAMVVDAPDAVFEIQVDGTTAATDIGSNAALIFTNPGSTVLGIGQAELNSGTFATDAAEQLKVLRVVAREDNELASDFTKVEVTINNHTEANNIAGI